MSKVMNIELFQLFYALVSILFVYILLPHGVYNLYWWARPSLEWAKVIDIKMLQLHATDAWVSIIAEIISYTFIFMIWIRLYA